MAFGKVIVRSESGVVEEYELTKPVTSVGRQPGNDIVLNTSAVSRYHARFDAADGRVYLVDLGTVNGTFINDKAVPAESRIALDSGDVVQMGDMALIFTSPEARQRFDISLTPSSTTVEHPSVPFRMVVDEPHQVVAPGARMQLVVQLQNLLDEELQISLGADGLNLSWVRFSRQDVLLVGQEIAEVLISIQPPRATNTRPGRYPLTLTAAVASDPSQALEIVREIDVVGYAGLAMVSGVQSRGGVYHIAVQNQGNVPLHIGVEGYDPRQLLEYQARPDSVSLAPGETRQVRLSVQSRRRGGLSEGQRVPFVILARGQNGSSFQAPVMAYYRPVKPGVGSWAAALGIPVVLGVALGVIALVLLGMFLLGIGPLGNAPVGSQPPATKAPAPVEPVAAAPTTDLSVIATYTPVPTAASSISSFSASPAEVVYRSNGRVTFNWTVGDVRSIRLADPNSNIQELPPETGSGSADYPIANLQPGVNQFNLIVVGTDGSQETRPAQVTTVWTPCAADPEVSVPREAPNPDAATALALPAPAAGETTVDVVIAGRTGPDAPGGPWLLVAYDDLINLDTTAWLPAEEVTCPAGVGPEDYAIVLPDGSPAP